MRHSDSLAGRSPQGEGTATAGPREAIGGQGGVPSVGQALAAVVVARPCAAEAGLPASILDAATCGVRVIGGAVSKEGAVGVERRAGIDSAATRRWRNAHDFARSSPSCGTTPHPHPAPGLAVCTRLDPVGTLTAVIDRAPPGPTVGTNARQRRRRRYVPLRRHLEQRECRPMVLAGRTGARVCFCFCVRFDPAGVERPGLARSSRAPSRGPVTSRPGAFRITAAAQAPRVRVLMRASAPWQAPASSSPGCASRSGG